MRKLSPSDAVEPEPLRGEIKQIPSTRTRRAIRCLAWLACVALLGCSSGDGSESVPPRESDSDSAPAVVKNAYGEAELYHPVYNVGGKVMRLGDGWAVLSLEAGDETTHEEGDTAGSGADEIRFELLSEAPMSLHLDEEHLALVQEVTILDSMGEEAMRVDTEQRHDDKTLAAGSYLLRVRSTHRNSTPVPVFFA